MRVSMRHAASGHQTLPIKQQTLVMRHVGMSRWLASLYLPLRYHASTCLYLPRRYLPIRYTRNWCRCIDAERVHVDARM